MNLGIIQILDSYTICCVIVGIVWNILESEDKNK